MAMKRLIVLAALLVLIPAAAATAQPPPKSDKTIEDMLHRNVDDLMGKQKPDGHWDHPQVIGMTALAALALKHSGDPRTATAVAKAVAFIAQQDVEYKTYSAGTVISLLYQVDPRRNYESMSKYASALVKTQQGVEYSGMFTYDLLGAPKKNASELRRGDNSNSQFGVLGLLFAERAGYQVPRQVWEGIRNHWVKTQNPDGGWGYTPGGNSYHNMTYAGTVSLHIAEEQLQWGAAMDRCKMAPPSRAGEQALKWVGDRFTTELNAYGLYALERLGILTGQSEFGGHYWYEELTGKILENGVGFSGPGSGGDADTAFLILFLARGREPIIVNKLHYYGDWNNNSYDVKHLVDYISDRMQTPMQWRIVTLQSKLENLLKVPILHFNGIKGPAFTDEEKIKLREYVMKGGVLLAQACRPDARGGSKEFDENFRALMEECFPEAQLKPLQAGHPIFVTPRKVITPPKVEVIQFKERIGVIYLPDGLCIDWQKEGSTAKPSLDVGVNIVFFVLKQAGKIPGAAKAGG
jgi:hypothetical protein